MRRNRGALLALVSGSAGFVGSVDAAFLSGNDLYALCTTPERDRFYLQDQAECRGYVAGVYDHMSRTDAFCPRRGVQMGQVTRIFVAYAKKNPQNLDRPAGHIVEEALRDAFPCQDGQ
jgi:hypothetical protein